MILVPLSILATTIKLYYDGLNAERRNGELIAGHNMCVPYSSTDTGVYGRNELG